MAVATRTDFAVEHLSVSAYTVPTDQPESDGTLAWDSTTIVVVEVQAGGATGLGYKYGPTNVNYGLLPPLADPRKDNRKPRMAERAIADFEAWLGVARGYSRSTSSAFATTDLPAVSATT